MLIRTVELPKIIVTIRFSATTEQKQLIGTADHRVVAALLWPVFSARCLGVMRPFSEIDIEGMQIIQRVIFHIHRSATTENEQPTQSEDLNVHSGLEKNRRPGESSFPYSRVFHSSSGMSQSGVWSISSVDNQAFPMVVSDAELPNIIVNGYTWFMLTTEEIQMILDRSQRMAAS